MLSYSIITITKNSAQTLERCINSVFKQEILPKEYIFVDACSKDTTCEIIESAKFANPQINFKIIRQNNKKGIYSAFNMGIKEANADLLFILNSDDWYTNDAVKIVIDTFETYPEAEIVLSAASFHNTNGQITKRLYRAFFLFPVLMPVIHPACFIRKSLYDKIGLYDENYRISSDYDFLYRCKQKNIKFKKIKKTLLNIQLGGAANSNRAIARQETCEIAQKYSHPFLPKLAYFIRKLLSK